MTTPVRPVALLLLLCSAGEPARAQDAGSPAPRPPAALTVSGLLSVQPEAFNTDLPYLDRSLAGTVPGFGVGVNLPPVGPLLFTLELSSTGSFEAVQRGRMVVGGGPARARHRDTLLSALAGVSLDAGRVRLEPKGGVSALLGTPSREGARYDDPAGALAFTGGLDAAVGATRRVALVTGLRYSYARRGPDGLLFGLGKHITRMGAGVRIALAR